MYWLREKKNNDVLCLKMAPPIMNGVTGRIFSLMTKQTKNKSVKIVVLRFLSCYCFLIFYVVSSWRCYDKARLSCVLDFWNAYRNGEKPGNGINIKYNNYNIITKLSALLFHKTYDTDSDSLLNRIVARDEIS